MVGLENPLHIALILVVVLFVFGAKRLPEMGKSMGEGLRGFKQSLSGETPAQHLSTQTHLPASDARAPAERESTTTR
jgi:sec-independent protein translocase protein TatA